jgi:hypothetical protein
MTNWEPPPKTSINAIEIQVISPTEVIIDGISCGKVCDAMANMPQFAGKFQVALEEAWNLRDNNNLDGTAGAGTALELPAKAENIGGAI